MYSKRYSFTCCASVVFLQLSCKIYFWSIFILMIVLQPLKDRLEVYREETGASLKKPNLVNFPPSLEPIPSKPLFFDLALNHLEMPNLEDRMEKKKPEKEGITSYVKGWFWGK